MSNVLWSGQPPLNTTGKGIRKLILFESVLGILPLNPSFFYFLPSSCLSNVHTFDSAKLTHGKFHIIPVHHSGTQDTLKIVIGLSISQALSPLLCHFHQVTDYHFFFGSFLPAITFMFSDWQGGQTVASILRTALPASVHSLAHFNYAINFQSFSPNFLCAILAAPITAYCLFSNLAVYDPMRSILKIKVLLPFLFVSIVHHFSKPPSQDLVGQSIHFNCSGLFVFETLVSTHTLHP